MVEGNNFGAGDANDRDDGFMGNFSISMNRDFEMMGDTDMVNEEEEEEKQEDV